MPAVEPYAQIDLDKLLEHLRLRGITVGTVELQNLQQVFARSPQLSHAGLQDLLCSLLAKDAAQRQTITRLYNQLIPFETDEQSEEVVTPSASRHRRMNKKDRPVSETGEETEAQEAPKEPLNIWRLGLWALALITVLMLGVAGWMSLPDAESEKKITPDTTQQKTIPSLPEPEEREEEKPGDLKLVKYIDLWYPTIEVKKISPWPRLLPPLLLFLGAGLGFSWLLQQALQRTRLRRPVPPKLSKARGQFYVPVSAKQADYHLLSGDERREMSWGIHHYLSDVPLDKLDIKRSVQRSAQTGLPQIEFERASREREVWLWQEQSSNNPDLIRHIDEIVQTLRPANIAVQRGYFRGLPEKVLDERGELVWSSRHEYPEHHPLVVIFADTTRLATSMQQNPDNAAVTLRLLSEWAHLCFVDRDGGLQALLNPHGLDCLLPAEVSGWLAQQGGMKPVTVKACAPDDVYRWAVACCLPERVLVEGEVRALHEHMGLQCAWQFTALTQYADEFGQGLDFSAVRTELLNEFGQWWRTDKENAGKALDFWLQRNREIDEALKASELAGEQGWDKTPKQQQLLLDRLVLQLWRKDDVAAAAMALHDMQSGGERLRGYVTRKLRQFSCGGFPLEDAHQEARIVLPWDWQDLSAETQQQLLICGFSGAEGKTSRLQLDKVSGLLLSVLAGFTLAGFVGGVHALWPQAVVIETRLNSAQPPEHLVLEKDTDDQLLLGTYKAGNWSKKPKDNDHRLVVNWQRLAGQPAQQSTGDDTAVWLLGESKQPQRPADQMDLSLVVINGDVEDQSVQRLAAFLLDTGNADRVVIGKHWRKNYLAWREAFKMLKQVQWFFIGDKPRYLPPAEQSYAFLTQTPAELLYLLQRDNTKYTAADWMQEFHRKPTLWARKKESKLETLELAHGMTLVKIPRGQFKRGSEQYDDEKPIRTVTLNNGFWMSQTEVTFEQYDAYVKAKNSKAVPAPNDQDWGRDQRPVINVSWDDAQDYLKWLSETNDKGLQCRLPTEAEWEYAARAGTETAYWWGDEASHDYANYGKDECCDGLIAGKDQWENTAPVGQFPPNPFGLNDMHGNVLEWVQDCYADTYNDAPVDGTAYEPTECAFRVLRGGSWDLSPDVLRSAFRFRFNPVNRGNFAGFRVVCPLIER